MWRAGLLLLVLLALPLASAQNCRSAPHVRMEQGPEVPPIALGAGAEDAFEVHVSCDGVPFTTPVASITVRVYTQEDVPGIEATLERNEYVVSGQDCLQDGGVRLPNTLRLNHTRPVIVQQYWVTVLAEASCEGFSSQVPRQTFFTVPIEGEFEAGPANQSITLGQNQNGRLEFWVRSTYNTPIMVATTFSWLEGRNLSAVIPPSQVSLDGVLGEPVEKRLAASLHTGHENGHVNYTSTYAVSLSAHPATAFRPEFYPGGPLGVVNGTFTAQVIGNFVPGPGALLLVGILVASALVASRRRRDA